MVWGNKRSIHWLPLWSVWEPWRRFQWDSKKFPGPVTESATVPYLDTEEELLSVELEGNQRANRPGRSVAQLDESGGDSSQWSLGVSNRGRAFRDSRLVDGEECDTAKKEGDQQRRR